MGRNTDGMSNLNRSVLRAKQPDTVLLVSGGQCKRLTVRDEQEEEKKSFRRYINGGEDL